MNTKQETVNPIKAALLAAISSRNTMLAELEKKGLIQRRSYGIEFSDTRHPRYAAWRLAESAYLMSLHAAEEAGIIKTHNASFSWVEQSAAKGAAL